MRKNVCFFILFLSIFFYNSVQGALLVDIPCSIVQPDGTKISCLVTGDEYYSYLHDKNGYTFIKDKSGWYKYAKKGRDGTIVATAYIVGHVDPAGLNLDKRNTISPERYLALRNQSYLSPSKKIKQDEAAAVMPTKGDIVNLVVFIQFLDDPGFTNDFETIEAALNGQGEDEISLKKYYQDVSYGKLNITSHFFPTAEEEEIDDGETSSSGGGGGCFLNRTSQVSNIKSQKIVAYVDSLYRASYQPKSDSNSRGYADETQRREREMDLIKDALIAVQDEIAASSVAGQLDSDNDGIIDNVTFVIAGMADVGGHGNLLWPHARNNIYFDVDSLNLSVQYYSFIFEDTGYFVSVACHEMFHTTGAPDLYSYSDLNKPLAKYWDLMAGTTGPIPQHMTVYMKYTYGKWGGYAIVGNKNLWYYLLPANQSHPTHNALVVTPSNSTTETIWTEYRSRTNKFDSKIPGTGLIFYRVNSTYQGKGNQEEGKMELYIFRPGGTTTAEGDIGKAFFNTDVGRTDFTSATDPKPFLYDGSEAAGVLVGKIQPFEDNGKNYMAFYLYKTLPTNLPLP